MEKRGLRRERRTEREGRMSLLYGWEMRLMLRCEKRSTRSHLLREKGAPALRPAKRLYSSDERGYFEQLGRALQNPSARGGRRGKNPRKRFPYQRKKKGGRD